jgi:hypothetical protein
VSYSADLDAFRREVESFIDGDDIRVVRAGPGPSGWEDFVWLACGKTESFVFKLHDRKGCGVEKQMRSVLPGLRAREAKRIADKAADDASMIWLYAGQVAA